MRINEILLIVYRASNIKSFPIDCKKIIDGIGYTLKSYGELAKAQSDLLLLHSVSSDAFTYFAKKLIVYNEKQYRRRIRFSLMHEVGHIVLNTDSEDEADAFASSILAPLPIVRMYGLTTADEISQKFDISISAANHVVLDLKKPFQDDGLLCDYFKQIEKEEWYKRMGLKPKRKTIARKAESYDVKLSDRQRMIANAYGMEWNDLQLARHDHKLYFG